MQVLVVAVVGTAHVTVRKSECNAGVAAAEIYKRHLLLNHNSYLLPAPFLSVLIVSQCPALQRRSATELTADSPVGPSSNARRQTDSHLNYSTNRYSKASSFVTVKALSLNERCRGCCPLVVLSGS